MEFNPYPDPFVYTPQSGRLEPKGPTKPVEFESPIAPTWVRPQASRPESLPEPSPPTRAPKPAVTKSTESQVPSASYPAGPDLEPDFSEFYEGDEFSKRSLWSFVGFFVVIGLIIGGWYFFANSGTPLSPPAGEKTPDLQPNLIAASLGGTIRNGGASVIIPPGALTSDMEIFIKRIAEGAAGASTDLYYLEPHGYKFLKHVTVIIPYKKNPSRLKYIQNGEIKYSPFAVDEASKTIRIEVMEF